MTKKSELMSPVDLEITTNITINRQEIVDIIVNEAEEKLIAKKKELTIEVLEIEKRINKQRETFNKSLSTMSKNTLEPAVSKMKDAIIAFCSKSNITANYYSNEQTEKTDTGNKLVGVNISATVNIVAHDAGRSRSDSMSVTTDKKVKPTKEMTNLFNSIENDTNILNKISTELINVKREIQDLPRHERRARAALASHAMGKTVEGAELLEKLRNRVIKGDKFLHALST